MRLPSGRWPVGAGKHPTHGTCTGGFECILDDAIVVERDDRILGLDGPGPLAIRRPAFESSGRLGAWNELTATHGDVLLADTAPKREAIPPRWRFAQVGIDTGEKGPCP